jgi:hypothetical protein
MTSVSLSIFFEGVAKHSTEMPSGGICSTMSACSDNNKKKTTIFGIHEAQLHQCRLWWSAIQRRRFRLSSMVTLSPKPMTISKRFSEINLPTVTSCSFVISYGFGANGGGGGVAVDAADRETIGVVGCCCCDNVGGDP